MAWHYIVKICDRFYADRRYGTILLSPYVSGAIKWNYVEQAYEAAIDSGEVFEIFKRSVPIPSFFNPWEREPNWMKLDVQIFDKGLIELRFNQQSFTTQEIQTAPIEYECDRPIAIRIPKNSK